MKYIIIFTIMSIAGTAGLVFEPDHQVPVEHIEFTDPLYINAQPA